jgi:TRAP-type C4-dicarboxylate transport system permease small subunit
MVILHRLDHLLAVVERTLIVLLLSGLLGLGLLQMLWRNLFAGGVLWADEFLRHVAVWLGVLGASLMTREQKHLRFDVLPQCLPSWCHPWCRLLTNLMAVLICALLCHAAWRFIQDERAAGTMLTCGIKTWVGQSIFPYGFLIMALRFLLQGLVTLQQLTQRTGQP